MSNFYACLRLFCVRFWLPWQICYANNYGRSAISSRRDSPGTYLYRQWSFSRIHIQFVLYSDVYYLPYGVLHHGGQPPDFWKNRQGQYDRFFSDTRKPLANRIVQRGLLYRVVGGYVGDRLAGRNNCGTYLPAGHSGYRNLSALKTWVRFSIIWKSAEFVSVLPASSTLQTISWFSGLEYLSTSLLWACLSSYPTNWIFWMH